MIPKYCNSESPTQHAFYIAGIFLQITPNQTPVTSLDSVTEQQWWDVMRSAWNKPPYDIDDARHFNPLPVLVGGTKKYMHIASKSDLKLLIGSVDEFLESLEPKMQLQKMGLALRLEVGPEMGGLEQGEGIIIAVKELRTVASNMLESFGQ
ncbi:uncharacterized protein HD556DRAFT_159710 [Suillus plorans]|uniref:Uncharacterized protein n=1 Tax=Suillus plorans TaxID=116603 RepID=A0A9P7DN78_9AGAM|nr:uncharacterized protein HD556DRAFT_159710 [Suillus plorans]KAG1798899.1 hypothetical protein HD556DRAFT_159710 [Suillus plorans]